MKLHELIERTTTYPVLAANLSKCVQFSINLTSLPIPEETLGLSAPIKFPFDNCYFALEEDDISVGIFSPYNDETAYTLELFSKTTDNDFFTMALGNAFSGKQFLWWEPNATWNEVSFAYHNKEDGDPDNVHDFLHIICQVMHMVASLLNNKQVTIDITPAPAKLNKKRAKRGKPPIFEYRTLKINVDAIATRTAHQGGTHASPRIHLRRGHIRRYKSGKEIWINAFTVGSKDRGIIHKDYKIIAGEHDQRRNTQSST